jgi:hypothetical protein
MVRFFLKGISLYHSGTIECGVTIGFAGIELSG